MPNFVLSTGFKGNTPTKQPVNDKPLSWSENFSKVRFNNTLKDDINNVEKNTAKNDVVIQRNNVKATDDDTSIVCFGSANSEKDTKRIFNQILNISEVAGDRNNIFGKINRERIFNGFYTTLDAANIPSINIDNTTLQSTYNNIKNSNITKINYVFVIYNYIYEVLYNTDVLDVFIADHNTFNTSNLYSNYTTYRLVSDVLLIELYIKNSTESLTDSQKTNLFNSYIDTFITNEIYASGDRVKIEQNIAKLRDSINKYIEIVQENKTKTEAQAEFGLTDSNVFSNNDTLKDNLVTFYSGKQLSVSENFYLINDDATSPYTSLYIKIENNNKIIRAVNGDVDTIVPIIINPTEGLDIFTTINTDETPTIKSLYKVSDISLTSDINFDTTNIEAYIDDIVNKIYVSNDASKDTFIIDDVIKGIISFFYLFSFAPSVETTLDSIPFVRLIASLELEESISSYITKLNKLSIPNDDDSLLNMLSTTSESAISKLISLILKLTIESYQTVREELITSNVSSSVTSVKANDEYFSAFNIQSLIFELDITELIDKITSFITDTCIFDDSDELTNTVNAITTIFVALNTFLGNNGMNNINSSINELIGNNKSPRLTVLFNNLKDISEFRNLLNGQIIIELDNSQP